MTTSILDVKWLIKVFITYIPVLSNLVNKNYVVRLSNCNFGTIWRKCQTFYNVTFLASLKDDKTILKATEIIKWKVKFMWKILLTLAYFQVWKNKLSLYCKLFKFIHICLWQSSGQFTKNIKYRPLLWVFGSTPTL